MHATKSNLYAESSAPPSQIEELYQHIRTFRRIPRGFRAIHIHFSVLDRLHRQPHHRREIATAFNRLINPYEGKLFWIQNFDLFFVCKDCPHSKLEQAKFDAFRAVGDSPVLKEIIENSQDDKLCDWYDLAVEYDVFYNLVDKMRRDSSPESDDDTENKPNLQKLMAGLDPEKETDPKVKEEKKHTPRESRTIPQYEHIFQKTVMPPIGPTELDKLERNILNMDMFNLIDQQNICVVMENVSPQVVFTKKYISLAEVNKSILPGYDISGDIWLFQRLTKTFDLKVMQALIDYKSFPDNVLSINMNVSTIATREFDTFIAKQKSLSEHPLVIELPLFDIMSDLTEYYRIQEKLDKLGCKICICKMDIQSLCVLDRGLMNVDFLKIRWNKSYLNAISGDNKERIKAAIKAQGKMRVVLSDCDTERAIRFGKEFGIVMYQGFEVDKLQSL